MTAAQRTLNRPLTKNRAARQEGRRVRAPFSLRCGAMLIDYLLLVSIVAISTLFARMLGGGARTAGSSVATIGILLAIIAALLNLGLLPGLSGVTAGKWATGLRIERVDGTPLTVPRALLRHFVGYPLSFVPLGLGFLAAAFTARGRGLHDIIAGTIVVREAGGTARVSRPGAAKGR